jgi:hypothetical protein
MNRERLTAIALALVLAACESRELVAPRSRARFGFSCCVHTLALGTGNDSSALMVWQNAINADTSDTVIGVIPKGSVHLHPPNVWPILIWSGRVRSHRYVDIGGYSKDSTIVYVDATATQPGDSGTLRGSTAFHVLDSHVHFHDLTIVSLADSTQRFKPNDGATDEAINFDGYNQSGEYGEVNNIRTRGFRTAGIDVYGMKGVFVHDNEIFCVSSNRTTHYDQSMGIWVRWLAPPPPPGVTNATVQANTIWDCGAEGIPITDVQNVQVRWNTISCLGGQNCPRGYVDSGKTAPLGIAIYSDARGCTSGLPSGHNRIDRNTIYSNGSLTGGIVLESYSEYANTIDSNFVQGVILLGIEDSPGTCPGYPTQHNVLTLNTVEKTINTTGFVPGWMPNGRSSYDIYTWGIGDTVTYNHVCSTDPNTISDGDTTGTTYFLGNTHITC